MAMFIPLYIYNCTPSVCSTGTLKQIREMCGDGFEYPCLESKFGKANLPFPLEYRFT